MPDFPHYPPLKKNEEDPVAKSIAKPNAFAKPGTTATRFRPLATKRAPRIRKKKRDPRQVTYY